VQLCSLNTSKFYVPGETKEIENLRKKAILNGALVVAEMIVKLSPNSSLVQKIQLEIIDNLDLNDIKIHVYAVYLYFKQMVVNRDQQNMNKTKRRSSIDKEKSEEERATEQEKEVEYLNDLETQL